MATSLIENTAPAADPATLQQAKDLLLITTTDHDSWLTDAITVSHRFLFGIDGVTGRTAITTTYKLVMDVWPTTIYLPRPPIQSVTSVKYIDLDGVQQTWASSKYHVDAAEDRPGRITPAYNESYPSIRSQNNAVEVLYVAGYGAASTNVPRDVQEMVLRHVALMFHYREPVSEREGKAVDMSLAAFVSRDRVIGF